MASEVFPNETIDKQDSKPVNESLIGIKFGYWTILSEKFGRNGVYYVKVQCICGKIHEHQFNNLKYGKTKSCGCKNSVYNHEDYIGKRFGHWTILSLETAETKVKRKSRAKYVFAKCKCGTERLVMLSNLRNGSSISCGCSYIHKNLVNKKSGRLLVKEELLESFNGHRMLKVVCDCGTVTTVRRSAFIHKGVRSCGCLADEARKISIKKAWKSTQIQDREKRIITDIISSYKSRARLRKPSLVFELTYDNVKHIIFQNCHYCRTEPDKERKDKISDLVLRWNGIDRFDNDKGYTKDNVVPCCKICNIMKQYLSYDQFRVHIEKIYKNLFL